MRPRHKVVGEIVVSPSRIGKGLVPQEEPRASAVRLVSLHRHRHLVVVVGDLKPVKRPRIRLQTHVLPRLPLGPGWDKIYPRAARVKPEFARHVVVFAPFRLDERVVLVRLADTLARRLVAPSRNLARRARHRRAHRRDTLGALTRGEPPGALREHGTQLVRRDVVAVRGDAEVHPNRVCMRPFLSLNRELHKVPRRARHLAKVPS
mmetsp:Transcript_11458/g.53263  ORF Transcript_11458/g.53263 Transcript_11458/m.53263 type:complete len:206 (-) Transcript_11458:428-1045(-)